MKKFIQFIIFFTLIFDGWLYYMSEMAFSGDRLLYAMAFIVIGIPLGLISLVLIIVLFGMRNK